MDFLKMRRGEDYDKLLAPDIPMIQSQIIDFIIYCKDTKQLSPSSIRGNVAAIKLFYEINDIDLKWRKINRFQGEFYRVVEDRSYTHEEIKKMVDVADLRDKAIILLMASTGMRLGAVPPLKMKDLTEINHYGGLYQIDVYKKYKEQYISYCTPEARMTIDDYLEFRRRLGERLQDTTPLFRKHFDKYDSMQVAHPIPITASTIKYLIKELLNKTGIRPPVKLTEEEKILGKPAKKTSLPMIHGFRKFVVTNMIRAKLEYNARETLVGHTLKSLDISYDRREQGELLEEYVKAIDYLTIDDLNKLRREVEHYKVKASQFDSLKAEIDQLKEMIKG
jgi:integrase